MAWDYGFAGVDIFFVISGFIITRVAARKSVGPFLRDRFTRIFPMWWLCLYVFLMVKPWAMDSARMWSSITLWPIIGEYRFPYLFAGWTLSFELLFYACAALVIINRLAPAILIAAFGVAMLLALATGAPIFRFFGNPIILEFLYGVAIARWSFKSSPMGAIALPAGFLLMIPFAALPYGLPENVVSLESWTRPLVIGLPAAMIVWGALQFEPKGRIARAFAYGGDASYSIYLIHPIMPWQPWAAPVTIAIGLVAHWLIEKPLIKAFRGALGAAPISDGSKRQAAT